MLHWNLKHVLRIIEKPGYCLSPLILQKAITDVPGTTRNPELSALSRLQDFSTSVSWPERMNETYSWEQKNLNREVVGGI